MRCGKVRRSLMAALDRALDDGEARAVEAHLAGCDACGAEASRWRTLHQALAALPQAAAVPAGLEQATLRRVRAELGAGEGDQPRRGWLGSWWWLPAPALAVVVLVMLWRPGGIPSPREQPPASGPRVATAPRPAAVEPAPVVAATETPPRDAVAPPPEVAEMPDLFLELPILEHLEKLQNFETIRTVELGRIEPAEDGQG